MLPDETGPLRTENVGQWRQGWDSRNIGGVVVHIITSVLFHIEETRPIYGS